MEIVVPKDFVYPYLFLLGYRVDPAGEPQAVGTVVVKGTFEFTSTGAPIALPLDQQLPIFQTDVPFWVPNGDFEGPDLSPWIAIGGSLEAVPDPDQPNNTWARFTSFGGINQLQQTITFNEPLAALPSQAFGLSFWVRADNASEEHPVTVSGYLEAVDSGNRIDEFAVQLTDESVQAIAVDPPEPWLAPEEQVGTALRVVFSHSGTPEQPVYFDNVQLIEGQSVLRYEHDLVPFKPHADVIVLGAAHPPDQPTGRPTGIWYTVLETSLGQRYEKMFDASTIKRFPTRTLLGWASRVEAAPSDGSISPEHNRKDQAGQDLENFYPRDPPEPGYPPLRGLPPGFDNRFYNGYDRTVFSTSPLPYFGDDTEITLRTERRTPSPPAPDIVSVRLPASRPGATLRLLNDRDDEETQPIPLVLDTLVIEPDRDRYWVTWRGTWPWQSDRADRTLTLTLQGDA